MATLDDILNGIRNVPDAISSAPINTNTLSQPSTLSFISADVAAATASLAPVAPTTAAPGAPYSAMYAFGDSLTDTGNVSLATLGMVPASPYADRSFSNGPVWAQDLAQSLGLPALKPSLAGGTDFAYGGAETGQTPVHTLNATDLDVAILAVPDAGSEPAGWRALYGLERFERCAGYCQRQLVDTRSAAGGRGRGCAKRDVGDQRASVPRRAEPACAERA